MIDGKPGLQCPYCVYVGWNKYDLKKHLKQANPLTRMCPRTTRAAFMALALFEQPAAAEQELGLGLGLGQEQEQEQVALVNSDQPSPNIALPEESSISLELFVSQSTESLAASFQVEDDLLGMKQEQGQGQEQEQVALVNSWFVDPPSPNIALFEEPSISLELIVPQSTESSASFQVEDGSLDMDGHPYQNWQDDE